MCSMGVFLGVWLRNFMKLISICNGVLLSSLIKSVSVVTFRGMRLRITIFNGRIICVWARLSSMTKIFSCFKISMAGNLSGNLNGIVSYL